MGGNAKNFWKLMAFGNGAHFREGFFHSSFCIHHSSLNAGMKKHARGLRQKPPRVGRCRRG
jgi:hypothetical protein